MSIGHVGLSVGEDDDHRDEPQSELSDVVGMGLPLGHGEYDEGPPWVVYERSWSRPVELPSDFL